MDRAAWVESAPITSLTRICYLEQKLTFVLFIFSDKFFKVTLEYACLLLWNTNAISRISKKKLYDISKAQPNTFSYRHSTTYSFLWRKCITPFSWRFCNGNATNLGRRQKHFEDIELSYFFLEFLWTYRLLSIFCFLFLQHSIRAILRQDPPFGKEEISWVCSSSNGCSTVSKSVEHWMQGFQLLENAVDIFCP